MTKIQKDDLVTHRIESQLGVHVSSITYSAPEGLMVNLARIGAGIANLIELKNRFQFKEVHIKTSNNLEINCNALFDNKEITLESLDECKIWSNSKSRSPYDPVAGTRML
jgi:hypothetical protein